ncbi:MAG: YncE family protein [Steroidobacteraceae bacterium]
MSHVTETHRGEPTRQACQGRRLLVASAFVLAFVSAHAAPRALAAGAPLILERSIVIPDVPVGPYSDHMDVDLAGKRLFAAPQAAKAVAVLDLEHGRVLKMIGGFGNPHSIFYSARLNRLFVTDGGSGDVKVFSGRDYSLIKTIRLDIGADGMVYDPRSRLLYVNNGGDDAGTRGSVISVVDVAAMRKVADIPLAAPDLEAAVIDSGRQLLYVDLVDESAVAVVDLRKRRPIATWKLPPDAGRNLAIALDIPHGRLYVACRESPMHGSLFVLDSADGRSIARLPIGGYPDGIFIDHKRQRIYVSTGVGHVETYAIGSGDVYRRLPRVDTAVMAKTSLYSGELDRLFVSLPHLTTDAQVMIFEPQDH